MSTRESNIRTFLDYMSDQQIYSLHSSLSARLLGSDNPLLHEQYLVVSNYIDRYIFPDESYQG